MICCGYDFPNTCKSHEAHRRPSNCSVLKIQTFISFPSLLLSWCIRYPILYWPQYIDKYFQGPVWLMWLLAWVTFSPEINKRWPQRSWILADVVRWTRQSAEEKWWLWRVPLGESLGDISLSRYFTEQATLVSVRSKRVWQLFVLCCLRVDTG